MNKINTTTKDTLNEGFSNELLEMAMCEWLVDKINEGIENKKLTGNRGGGLFECSWYVLEDIMDRYGNSIPGEDSFNYDAYMDEVLPQTYNMAYPSPSNSKLDKDEILMNVLGLGQDSYFYNCVKKGGYTDFQKNYVGAFYNVFGILGIESSIENDGTFKCNCTDIFKMNDNQYQSLKEIFKISEYPYRVAEWCEIGYYGYLQYTPEFDLAPIEKELEEYIENKSDTSVRWANLTLLNNIKNNKSIQGQKFYDLSQEYNDWDDGIGFIVDGQFEFITDYPYIITSELKNGYFVGTRTLPKAEQEYTLFKFDGNEFENVKNISKFENKDISNLEEFLKPETSNVLLGDTIDDMPLTEVKYDEPKIEFTPRPNTTPKADMDKGLKK